MLRVVHIKNELTYMYEILVTGPLGASECAGECRFSADLC